MLDYKLMDISIDIKVEQDLLDYRITGDVNVKYPNRDDLSFVHSSDYINEVDVEDLDSALSKEFEHFMISLSYRLSHKIVSGAKEEE